MSDQNSRLWKLLEQGQSVWLDSIRRGQIKSGELLGLIKNDALRGETANPSIFEKAISGSADYDDQIAELAAQGLDANAIYERVATDDVRMACDVFRPVYDETGGADGFVSLEVSPKLAYDTAGTLSEVRRFWKIVDRPNLMIKIPGTPEGVPAIEQALYEGININITLLFAVEAYEQVAWAFVRALERRAAESKPIQRIASVASFFVSRIDTLADKQIDARLAQEQDPPTRERLGALKGKIAIANAKVAYQSFGHIFTDPRFATLKTQGARVQRPLWASTSTKNPAYPDTLYVDELIGPDTINTLPLETIQAFNDHGTVARTLDRDIETAYDQIEQFDASGLSLKAVTDQVLKEGVEKFDESLDQLLQVIDKKRTLAKTSAAPRGPVSPGDIDAAVQARLKQAGQDHVVERLWQKDASLWSDDPTRQGEMQNRLGWLNVATAMRAQIDNLKEFTEEVIAAGFKHVLLLGMGGSSLAPEVMLHTFGIAAGHPNFAVLDTTDPATVREYLREMNPEDTLYIVSSKSGTTLETDSFYRFFYGHVLDKRGDQAGRSFIAITDPGTPLEKLAEERHFRRVFTNPPDIGGRYSALSYFGLVPAALIGIDLARLLDSAEEMMRTCRPGADGEENPGLWLGSMLGELGMHGRDKITFVLSQGIGRFGTWAEQLLAESTGKSAEKGREGRGLVPIEGEPPGDPSVYGTDRVFVSMRMGEGSAPAVDDALARLEQAGHPVVRLQLKDAYALGGEFFRWEFATAVAGIGLGINPFDEPNVAESKANTNRVLEEYKDGCELPTFDAEASGGGVSLYWNNAPQGEGSIEIRLRQFLDQTRPGDYIALMAFLTHSRADDKSLSAARLALRDHYHAATTVGYGPRFLHSTGQLHKGGPNEGVFIQITGTETHDVDIPGRVYSFGVLEAAQAIGDRQALENHGRRVLRLHLAEGSDVFAIEQVIASALAIGATAPAAANISAPAGDGAGHSQTAAGAPGDSKTTGARSEGEGKPEGGEAAKGPKQGKGKRAAGGKKSAGRRKPSTSRTRR